MEAPLPSRGKTTIQMLPRDLLIKVFKYLKVPERCAASLVCRHWFRLERSLPHYMKSYIDAKEMRLVLRRFPFLKCLNIRIIAELLPNKISDESILDGSAFQRYLALGVPLQLQEVAGTRLERISTCNCASVHTVPGFMDYAINLIGQWCPELLYFAFHHANYFSDGALLSLSKCSDLLELRLSSLPIVTDEGLIYIANCCKRLSVLMLSSCPNITSIGLTSIGKNCTELKFLETNEMNISFPEKRMRLNDDEDPSSPSTRNSIQSSVFPNIEVLKLSCCTSENQYLTALFSGSVKLKAVVVQSCTEIDDRFLQKVILPAQNLQCLILKDCEEITDEGLKPVSRECTQLKRLLLSGCSADVTSICIKSFAENSYSIELLELKWCAGIGDVLIDLPAMENSATALTSVGVESTQLSARSSEIQPLINFTDPVTPSGEENTVTRRSESYEFASSAALSAFPNIVNRNQPIIAWKKLKEIHFEGLSALSNATIASIAKTCPLLTHLKIEYCRKISDESIIAIAKAKLPLLSLHLTGFKARELQDSSLIALAHGCHSLQCFFAKACAGLTIHGLQFLMDKCPLLTSISLPLCNNLSNFDVAKLERICNHRRSSISLNLNHSKCHTSTVVSEWCNVDSFVYGCSFCTKQESS